MDSYRSRKHCLLLYPEDPSHVNALKHIERYYNYAYILHDKDMNKEGKLKKQHWHVVIQCQNATYNTAFAKELGIAINYIEECRNYDAALKYLVHRDEETKYQYDFKDVKGPLKKKLAKILQDEIVPESEKANDIINMILSHPGYLSAAALGAMVCAVDKWSTFRRSVSFYLRVLDDHNEKYSVDFEQFEKVEYDEDLCSRS